MTTRAFKTKRKHDETYEFRDKLGLTASDVKELKEIEELMTQLKDEKELMEQRGEWTDNMQEASNNLSESLMERFFAIVSVDVPNSQRRRRGSIRQRTIDGLEEDDWFVEDIVEGVDVGPAATLALLLPSSADEALRTSTLLPLRSKLTDDGK